ncbi:MAG: serine protease [Rubricoccaceae bacterium]|nr:serine protease [Rubricoccaceae bacterium]
MRVCRTVLLLVILAPLGGAVAAQDGDAYRLLLFAAPDHRVASVGEAVTFEVEGLAVPQSDAAAEALVGAFSDLALPPEAEQAFDVAAAGDLVARRRAGTQVYELSRRFTLVPRRVGALTIPAVTIALADTAFATAPQVVHAYRPYEAQAAQRSVVPLVVEGRVGTQRVQRVGSGFFMAEDALVTAYHVVLGAERVRLQLPGGRHVTTTRAWAVDPERDVAVLWVDPRAVEAAGVRPLELALAYDADLAGAAEEGVAFTAGWPQGVQRPTAGARYPGVRLGPADYLRVSANAVRPGDSGGPLLDVRGRVLGVVASGRSTDGTRDVLREDLCLATDPRHALAARLAQPRPRSLRRVLAEAAAAPNATALDAATVLLNPAFAPGDDGALARLTEAARRAPDDAPLQFLAGSVYQALGHDGRALAAFRAALADASDYFPARYALGHLHYERGDLDAAEASFEKTHEAAPYARLAALALARVHTRRLRYEEAAGAIHEVLDHDPGYAPALYLLGYGLLARGRTDEAEALAVRLDRLDPGWADALRLHLRREVLRPAALAALPRAEVPAP